MAERDDLLQQALDRWGASKQMRLLQEECAELTAMVNRFERGRASGLQVAEEVADVLIMCAQARRILGAEVVDKAVARKMARLAERLMRGESG